jgi:6-pyruvoyl tetrahydropterin synthase-like protein
MQTYCIRVCIPIYHGSSCDRQKAHYHTVEIACYIQKSDSQFQRFTDIERDIHAYLNRYAKQFLNEMPEFQQDTSIENIGEVFFAGLTEHLWKQGITLKRLEIGETPLRLYVIYCQED